VHSAYHAPRIIVSFILYKQAGRSKRTENEAVAEAHFSGRLEVACETN